MNRGGRVLGWQLRIVTLILVSLLSSLGGFAAAQQDKDHKLHFDSPAGGQLQGLVDMELTAPADTTTVRLFLDGTRLTELTDEYAVATKATPVWHTVFDTDYFQNGPHTLRAVAVTTRGTIQTSEVVDIHNAAFKDESLDGTWRFATSDDFPIGTLEGSKPAATSSGWNDGDWSKIVVPNSLDVLDEKWSRSSGLLGEYRRTFLVKSQTAAKELYLHSDSCFWMCRYFVNGVEIGDSTGGYLPRRFRITQAVHPGANSLSIIIDSRASTMGIFNLRYYYWNYSGLLQDVSLEHFAPLDIAEMRTQGSAEGLLTILPYVVNTTGHEAHLTGTILVANPSGQEVLSTRVDILVPVSGEALNPIRLRINHPELWDLDHPNLYRISFKPDQGSHEVTETTGFRDITIRDGNLLLNGRPVLGLQGFDRHADYPGLGKSQPAALADREIKQLHDKGFRIFRPAHYPTTKPELDAADKYGMLVLEEINVTGMSGEQLKSPEILNFAHSQLARMIERDRSHPSVFAWSIGNENRTDEAGSDIYVHDVIAYGKSLDATRPFTEVSAQLRHDICYSYMDFLAVNIYAGWYTHSISDVVPELDALEAYAGDKPMVLTEYGAEAVVGRPGTGKGTEYYQALTVDEHNRLLKGMAHLIGKMYWTSTEFVVGPKWDGGNPNPVPPFHTKGLLTYYRQPKLAWRVMFSPIDIEKIPTLYVGENLPGDMSVKLTLRNREPRSVSGRMIPDLPNGITTSTAEQPFTLAPNGTATLTLHLHIDKVPHNGSEGLVHAVVDSETEAMPQLLEFRMSCSACSLETTARPTNVP